MLSDRERRLLSNLEQQLEVGDPNLAQQLEGADSEARAQVCRNRRQEAILGLLLLSAAFALLFGSSGTVVALLIIAGTMALVLYFHRHESMVQRSGTARTRDRSPLRQPLQPSVTRPTSSPPRRPGWQGRGSRLCCCGRLGRWRCPRWRAADQVLGVQPWFVVHRVEQLPNRLRFRRPEPSIRYTEASLAVAMKLGEEPYAQS